MSWKAGPFQHYLTGTNGHGSDTPMPVLRLSLPFAPPAAARRQPLPARLAQVWHRWLAPTEPKLDLDNLAEHRLRDLGFLDGRGPSPRRPGWMRI